MRKAERLTNFYESLEDLHKNFPDLRFGQLMLNFLHWHEINFSSDFFYVEEEEFLTRFKMFLDDLKNK